MATTKQILIRVSVEQHRVLAEKAQAAGVSIPALIRDHLNDIKVSENRERRRFDQLLLARIGKGLELVVEQCRSRDEKIEMVDVLARLIAIERELQHWKEYHGS
jgi:hypothetical protein